MRKLKGKSIMLRVNGKTIALATSCTVNTTTQTVDARTKDDPTGPAAEFDYVDWTANSENMVGANENVTGQMLYAQLLELQLAGTFVDLSLDIVTDYTGKVPATDWKTDASANDAFKPYGGKALIDSLALSAPNEGNATVSIGFKAAGPLELVTTAE